MNDAGHMIFTGPCEAIPWYLRIFSGEFCDDPSWDRKYAHGLMKHLVTAFLLAELKSDTDAAGALARGTKDIRGVGYETEGFGETE